MPILKENSFFYLKAFTSKIINKVFMPNLKPMRGVAQNFDAFRLPSRESTFKGKDVQCFNQSQNLDQTYSKFVLQPFLRDYTLFYK